MISARSESGSSRMPPPAAASAASSCRNSGLPPLRSYSAVEQLRVGASPSSCAASSSVATCPSGCNVNDTTVARSVSGGQATSLPGRIAVIEREAIPAERDDEVLEQTDQRGVGPVEVVDRQHDRALVRAQLERRG